MSSLTNHDIIRYASEAGIFYFRGVYMRDTLPKSGALARECGIVNLDSSDGRGTHWVCYHKYGSNRIYFDSFGQVPPIEIQKYLKTKREFDIQRNSDIVQHINSTNCGQLCLFVLEALGRGSSFQTILTTLRQQYGYS